MEFSFLEILNLLLRRYKFILISMFLSFIIFYIFSRFYISPTYTSSVQMYVDQTDTLETADLNQLNYAQKVVTTYINFLQTKKFYNSVAEQCNLNYSAGQIKNMTTIQDIDNTEIFQIIVRSHSADDTYVLTKTMQEVAPRLINSIKNYARISVVDPPVFPQQPSGPNIRQNALKGGLLGLMIAIIAVFLWEIIDMKVKNQADLMKKYNISILGLIPNYNNSIPKAIRFLKKVPYLNKYWRIEKHHINVNEESKFIIHEAFNSLRTNLRFILRNDNCKKIIINSPLPNDGKSTICMNLAVTIAQSGSKVLILDCDLRKGIMHNLLHLSKAPGLSDVLSGMVNEDEAIQYTNYDNLQVITMGMLPPNPTELLGSNQMEELIRRLEKYYDYIIFDTPPVNVVSDTLSLVKITDGIIIVAREGVTTYPSITSAVNKYRFANVNILGFILNAVMPNQGIKKESIYYRKYSKK